MSLFLIPTLYLGSTSVNHRFIVLFQHQQTHVQAIVLCVAVAATQPTQSAASEAGAQLSPQYFDVSSHGTWASSKKEKKSGLYAHSSSGYLTLSMTKTAHNCKGKSPLATEPREQLMAKMQGEQTESQQRHLRE